MDLLGSPQRSYPIDPYRGHQQPNLGGAHGRCAEYPPHRRRQPACSHRWNISVTASRSASAVMWRPPEIEAVIGVIDSSRELCRVG